MEIMIYVISWVRRLSDVQISVLSIQMYVPKKIPMETPIASFFVCENYEVLIISNLYGFEIAKTFMKNKLT